MNLTKLQGMAIQLLFKYKLNGWDFQLTDTGRRLGCCKYDKFRIEISRYHAEHSPEEKVIDTLLHEIAHALVGPGHGHDNTWKVVAMRLGATPRACDDSIETVQKPGDWQAKCSCCQRVWNKYRRPKRLTGWFCTCPARPALVFEWAGEVDLKPILPKVFTAKCNGCDMVHKKSQRPTQLLRCRCRKGSPLVWTEATT